MIKLYKEDLRERYNDTIRIPSREASHGCIQFYFKSKSKSYELIKIQCMNKPCEECYNKIFILGNTKKGNLSDVF